MNKRFYRLILIICIIFIISGTTRAQQVGTTSFQFLKVAPDARATGMGEAISSVVNSANGVFYNPAAIADVSKFDVAISRNQWVVETVFNSVAIAYTVSGLGTFGVQAMFVDFGDIKETSVVDLGYQSGVYNPGLTGNTFSPSSMVVGLTFARALTDKFTFGITTKYASEDLYVEKASGIMFDIGMKYKTGFRSIELSTVLRHFGSEIKFVEESFPTPQTFTIGISSNLISSGDAFFMNSNLHRIIFSYDLCQPRDYGQQHHVGIEYAFQDMIFLRGGYKINYDEEGFGFGGGVKLSLFRIDYSYVDFGDYLDAVHRFSFGFKID